MRGSAAVVLAVGINGIGGFAFWWAAAAMHPAEAVGSAQRLFSLVMFVNYATSMGLPIVVARWCSDRSPQSSAVLRWAFLYTCAASIVGAAVLVPLAPADVTRPIWGAGPLVAIAATVALVAGISFAVLVEVRLIALRAWRWVVLRAVGVAVLRLPLLWVDVGDDATWLFLVVAGAPALSGLLGVHLLHRREHPERTWWSRPPDRWRPLLRYAWVNYIGLLGSQGPTYIVPFVVAVLVRGEEYAPFYLAWAVATIVFAVPHLIGQALLAESSKAAAPRDEQVRLALLLSVGAMIVVAVGSIGLRMTVHHHVGSELRGALELLPWLVTPAVPWAVTAILLARARLRGDAGVVILVTGSFFTCSLAFVALMAAGGGIDGAARGWVLANVVTMLVALAALTFERRPSPWTMTVSANPSGCVELVTKP